MKSVRRLLRSVLERVTKTYYEGPEPPSRLREGVLLFRLTNPAATPADWVGFASASIAAAYRDGFVRGLEWRERGLLDKPSDDADKVADAAVNEWLLADEGTPLRERLDSGNDPDDPLAGMSPAARVMHADLMGRMYGTHRVILEPVDGEVDVNDDFGKVPG